MTGGQHFFLCFFFYRKKKLKRARRGFPPIGGLHFSVVVVVPRCSKTRRRCRFVPWDPLTNERGRGGGVISVENSLPFYFQTNIFVDLLSRSVSNHQSWPGTKTTTAKRTGWIVSLLFFFTEFFYRVFICFFFFGFLAFFFLFGTPSRRLLSTSEACEQKKSGRIRFYFFFNRSVNIDH